MSILFRHIGFEWPNGQTVFNELNFSLEKKTYGLVGANGIGKTTLAHLISGELKPTCGQVFRGTDSVHLFQQVSTPSVISVSEFISSTVLREDHITNSILKNISRDRLCTELSGGEWTRVRLARAALSGSSFLILDEPTNHLDQSGRQAVHEFINLFPGGILLISHDRHLLEKVDEILELTPHGIATYGGGWNNYFQARAGERQRLADDLRYAKRQHLKARQERHQKIQHQEKRQRRAQATAADSGLPKILLGKRKRASENTHGKIDLATGQKIEGALTKAWESYQHLKIDPIMYARLPKLNSIQGKIAIEAQDFNFRFGGSAQDLWKHPLNFSFRGPCRIAVRGANGAGKSTLLKLLKQESLPVSCPSNPRTKWVRV